MLTLVSCSLVLLLLFVTIPHAGAQELNAVYIYSTDLDSAQGFEMLLEANGVTVDIIDKASASTWDYSGYGLIIIGHETGTLGNWDPGAAVVSINDTKLPVLGIYYGGASFFEELGLFCNWGNGGWANLTNVYVFDAANPVFNHPTKIDVPSDRLIELYDAPTDTHVIYMPTLIEDVHPIGQANFSAVYFPIVQESWRYILWGFREPPANMTQVGKELFVNTALWLLTWTVPEFPSSIILPLFMIATLLAVIVYQRKHSRGLSNNPLFLFVSSFCYASPNS
jgi:hypothetical protein